jgi:hypothetical protein
VTSILINISPRSPQFQIDSDKGKNDPVQFSGAANEGALIVNAMIKPEITAVDGSVMNQAL